MAERHPLEETEYWTRVLQVMAGQLVRRYAGQQDREPLVEDLTAEGWIVLCEQGVEGAHVRLKVRQAMLDALAKWLYGVTWNQAPRAWTCQVSMSEAEEVWELPAETPAQGSDLAARQVLAQVWQASAPRARQVLVMLAEQESQRLDAQAYRAAGMTADSVHDDRVRLRQAARQAQGF
jgi:hypothetical protein